MAFDEQLRRAFETLTDRLRDDLSRQLDEVAAELVRTAAAEHQQALADATAGALADAKVEHEAAVAAVTRDHEIALEQATVEVARRAREEAEADAQRDISVRIANATSVAESRAREQASAEAEARIAQLEAALNDAEQRARAAQDESRAAIERVASDAHVQARTSDADALERILSAVREIDSARSLSAVLDALVKAAGREARRAGMLVARGGQLRAWCFTGFDEQFDQSQPFDVRFADAGIIEHAIRERRTVVGDATSAPRFAALPAGHLAIAVPLALAGEVVAVLYGDDGDTNAGPVAEHLELLARHASSALEAITAFKTARALVENAPTSEASPVADPEESARRFARLLVSEIKLYHEAEVLAGRRERNLASRLAGEIERARALYEERVPASVRAGGDYFRAELVRTLASGDPSLLGEAGEPR